MWVFFLLYIASAALLATGNVVPSLALYGLTTVIAVLVRGEYPNREREEKLNA